MSTNALIKPGKRLVLPYNASSLTPGASPDDLTVRSLLTGPLGRKFLRTIGGSDGFGFNEAADVIETLTDGTNTNDLWTAYQQSVQLWNQERSALVDFLTYRVSQPTEAIPTGHSGARMERASEYGVPRAYRPGGEFAYLGFDFSWFDMGLRYTWEFLSEATAAQLDAINNQALEADNILMFEMIMWTLFNNVNRGVSIKSRPYTVYTFWNADGEVPDRYRTNTFDGTHNHYLVSGSATVDSGDLDDMYEHLAHHGYKRSNGYNLVLMVNQAQGDVIRTFRSPVAGGTDKFDFIPAQGTPTFLLPDQLRVADTAQQPAATLNGMEVIGKYGEWTVVQEDYITAGYMVGFATGGRDNIQNPIGIREHANPALRGLRLVKGRSPDYPLQEAYYQRGMGTGIRHRGAGVIMQVKASGTYVPPADYAEMP